MHCGMRGTSARGLPKNPFYHTGIWTRLFCRSSVVSKAGSVWHRSHWLPARQTPRSSPELTPSSRPACPPASLVLLRDALRDKDANGRSFWMPLTTLPPIYHLFSQCERNKHKQHHTITTKTCVYQRGPITNLLKPLCSGAGYWHKFHVLIRFWFTSMWFI